MNGYVIAAIAAGIIAILTNAAQTANNGIPISFAAVVVGFAVWWAILAVIVTVWRHVAKTSDQS